eukprot:TRINITY_DN1220_c0_g1_i2.p14 TRINITY_DN1220_c0_g1~~TRINITY_DN1220_c0_g1_i2.p14  ORF type:complete len:52 (-),score=19.26 TRINITY_DN1220_c0_g1_i2:2-157(-)
MNQLWTNSQVEALSECPFDDVCVILIIFCQIKKKKYRLRGRSSETAKAHRG